MLCLIIICYGTILSYLYHVINISSSIIIEIKPNRLSYFLRYQYFFVAQDSCCLKSWPVLRKCKNFHSQLWTAASSEVRHVEKDVFFARALCPNWRGWQVSPTTIIITVKWLRSCLESFLAHCPDSITFYFFIAKNGRQRHHFNILVR